MKHTPGPWKASPIYPNEDPEDYDIKCAAEGYRERWIVATCRNRIMKPGENLANARLIASAPKMRKALELVLEAIQEPVINAVLCDAYIERMIDEILPS